MLKILPDNNHTVKVDRKNCSKSHQWYLDGEIEQMVGTDLAVVYNLDEYPEFMRQFIKHEGRLMSDTMHIENPQWIKDLYITGIVPVQVEGVNEPCIGFFWVSSEWNLYNISTSEGRVKSTEWEQNGLVCLASDKEACDNAMEQILRFIK